MQLVFQCQKEIVRYEITRSNKKLIVTSSETNYMPKELPWWRLFDKGKERIQEIITDKLNDDDFMKAIVFQMQRYGYSLKASLK